MTDIEPIHVEVAYARPDKQKIISLLVEPGTTAQLVVEKSNIVAFFPEIDMSNLKLGLFGQALGTKGLKPSQEYEVQSGDRIEIYRPLICDPKEVRKKRAEKAKLEKEAAKAAN